MNGENADLICRPWEKGEAISIELKANLHIKPEIVEFGCCDSGKTISGVEYLELSRKERKNWFPLLSEVKLLDASTKILEIGTSYINPAGERVIAEKEE